MQIKIITITIAIMAILFCSTTGFTVTINVKDAPYNAAGNGTANDTTAIQNAINAAAAGDTVYFPAGTYKITSTVTVDSEMTLNGNGIANTTINFDFGTTNRNLFYISGNNVTVSNITFDGTNLPDANVNAYVIKINGTNRLNTLGDNASIEYCSFVNMEAKGFKSTLNPPEPDTEQPADYYKTNLYVTHAIYMMYSNNSNVSNCNFDDISGAGIFVTESNETTVNNNTIDNTGWYSIQFDSNCHGAEITYNTIGGTKDHIRYFGGSINIMSQVPKPRCSRIIIDHNTISGVHSYGAAIRIQSNSYTEITNNTVEDATITPNAEGQPVAILQHIAVDARTGKIDDVWFNNGPVDHILISGNTLKPGLSNVSGGTEGQVGIYVKNYQQGTEMPFAYGSNIIITNNSIESISSTKFFEHGISVNGHAGGLRKIDISDNTISGTPGATNPIGGTNGLISINAFTTNPMDTVSIEGNDLSFFGTLTPTSAEVGIFMAECDDIEVRNNTIDGFYFGVRLYTSVGNNIYGLTDSSNIFTNNTIDILKPSGYTLNTASTTITIPTWTTPTDDLIAHYKFDNDVTDSAGNNDGTAYGSPTYVTGVNGQAISLDGVDDYVEIDHDDSLNFSDSITITMWVRPDTYEYGTGTHLISKYSDTTDTNFRWYFRGEDYGSPGLTIVYINGGGAWKQGSGNTVIGLDDWCHLGWTYNKADGGVLYVDGIRVGSFVGSGRLATNEEPIWIGAWDTISNFFDGDIDDLKIWNRELSKSEIETEAGL